MERQVPSLPEGYTIYVGPEEVQIRKNGRPLTPRRENMTLRWIIMQKRYDPEELVKETFPELSDNEITCKVYADFKEPKREQTFQQEIVPGVTLIKLYDEPSYELDTPVWCNIGWYIKQSYGGLIINITNGDSRREWREIYFATKYCQKCVAAQLRDFFAMYPQLLEKPDYL